MYNLSIRSNGKEFKTIPSRESGFYVPGQSNHMIKITDQNGKDFILAGQNNDELKIFEIKTQANDVK